MRLLWERLFISWRVHVFKKVNKIYHETYTIQMSGSERQSSVRLLNFSYDIYFHPPTKDRQKKTSKASMFKLFIRGWNIHDERNIMGKFLSGVHPLVAALCTLARHLHTLTKTMLVPCVEHNMKPFSFH